VPPELFGPVGLLVALSLAVRALWLDHLRADQDDRDQRDRAIALAEGVVPTLKELAAAQAATNRDAAERHRRSDDR
jgi:2-polyprenyl-6-methoxyphenol hydroxylase-like FAD-dependent oxidoreductase